MNKFRVLLSLVLVALLISAAGAGRALANDDQLVFKARLLGSNEVPPRETEARGKAEFKVSEDGQSIWFKLSVTRIENVVAAHIHTGAAGVNGGVIVGLYGAAPGGGPIRGKISSGVITQANLAAGWTMEMLIAAMISGDTYVNVHTNDGVGDINTGPGDFPGGEIRGQIFLVD
jgi:hypothetical protein